MAKISTWMPLYIGDYLADTMHLEAREHGAYLLLLMHYWRSGPLPDNDRALAGIARVDRKTWETDTGPIVRGFFTARDGFLHQKRIDQERAQADALSAKKRSAANSRWNGEKEHKVSTGNAGAPPSAPPPAYAGAYANGGALADADACAEGGDVHMPSRAGASPSPLQRKKEPPVGPPQSRGGRRRRRNSVLAMTEAENDAWAEQVLAKVAADRQREREAQEASREAAAH